MQRRQFMATAAATVATASVAGCSGILGGDDGGGSGPESAVQNYVDAVNDNDVGALKDSIHSESPEAGGSISESDLEPVDMSLESSEVTQGPEDGQATVEAEIEFTYMGESQTDTMTFDVREEDGEWKIYSTSGM